MQLIANPASTFIPYTAWLRLIDDSHIGTERKGIVSILTRGKAGKSLVSLANLSMVRFFDVLEFFIVCRTPGSSGVLSPTPV